MDGMTVALHRRANLSQSRELHWTHIISSADYNWLKKGSANQSWSISQPS